MRAGKRAAMMVGLLLATPAAAETIRVEGVFAAGAREASLLPTIGVDLFAGPDGEALGMAIERRLAKLAADGVPHAQIIAPALRPDGLLSGRAASSVEDFGYVEGRERCVEKKDKKCVRRETYKVRCTRRTVTLRADLSLARRSDGRVLYAKPQSRSDTGSWCEDGGIGISVDAAVHSIVESIARDVRLDLAPHRESYTIRVSEERDRLPAAAAARFREAVRLTKHDAGQACAAFAEVDREAPDHGPTLFNLALCAEAVGRYPDAVDLYMRARVFAPGAGREVSKGLARVTALSAGRDDVARMAAR